ncbi:sulfurtransferase TusA family protein [Pseudocolwellia sp. AS88]|jgi:TusA-related sulfurtransferase|uniref:sulfurtransferase TusA family protein n=2 Tax=Colwelliaceae TaxID=267889 RepID=UPI0026F9AA6D|nr:sulfurtransferase TusA family protein [Pseudocolwellia sp. AS88]
MLTFVIVFKSISLYFKEPFKYKVKGGKLAFMLHKYDATNEKCPLPLVKMRVILKKMQTNDKCLISIADKGSKNDIPKYLTQAGYPFSSTVSASGIVELLIENR